MDPKDNKNRENPNSENQTMDKEKKRILVKLMLPKTEPAAEAAAQPSPAAAEAKTEEEARMHYCRQCDRSFTSGKALGGHMSSAHVQGNKEFSGKKFRAAAAHRGGASSPYACSECGKVFPTEKSLCGHMRSHPGREWRGIHPPMWDKRRASPENSPEPARSRDGEGSGRVVELASSLEALPSSAKRARGPIRPVVDAPPPPPAWGEDGATEVIAARQLMRLLNSYQREGPSRPEFDRSCLQRKLDVNENQGPRPEMEQRKFRIDENQGPGRPGMDRSCFAKKLDVNDNQGLRPEVEQRKLKISENQGPSWPGMDRSCFPKKLKVSENQGPRPEMDNSWLNLQKKVRMNENHGRPEMEDRAPEFVKKQKMGFEDYVESNYNGNKGKEKIHFEGIKEENGMMKRSSSNSISSPEIYKCETCNKTFTCHQALGGHRASHNKFKMSIVNSTTQTNDNNNVVAVSITDQQQQHSHSHSHSHSQGTDDRDENNGAHVCEICNRGFSSGQALGGHKRCHSSMVEENKKNVPSFVMAFDLNLTPEPEDAQGSKDQD